MTAPRTSANPVNPVNPVNPATRHAAARRPWLFTRGGASPRPGDPAPPATLALRAVLFDRDGTLVADVPYNPDPERVVARPGARAALELLRDRGVAVGVVSNQSGVARGLLTRDDVVAVANRVEDVVGPVDVWAVCPHHPDDGCRCRKPAPGLIRAACGWLGVDPHHTAVVGDIGGDVAAAQAAGAHGLLVPTPATRRAEVAAASRRAPDPLAAVRQLLGDGDGDRDHDHDHDHDRDHGSSSARYRDDGTAPSPHSWEVP